MVAISVVTASTSAWVVTSKSEHTASLRKSAELKKRENIELTALQAELQTKLTPDPAPIVLEDAHSQVLLGLRELALEHDIKISAMTPERQVAASGSSLDALADTVPGSKSLKSVRYRLVGTYKYYEGLKKFVATTDRFPMSVVHFNAEQKTFTLIFRTYGLTGR